MSLRKGRVQYPCGVFRLGTLSHVSAAGVNNGVNVNEKTPTSVVFLTTTGLSERNGPSVGNPGIEPAPSPLSGALVLLSMRWHHGNSKEERHVMSAAGTHFHIDGFGVQRNQQFSCRSLQKQQKQRI